MAILDFSNHNLEASQPCLVKPLNPYAVPYLKAADFSVSPVRLPCPELYPITLQLPPFPVPVAYPPIVLLTTPYPLTKYYYTECSVPPIDAAAVPVVSCDRLKTQKYLVGGDVEDAPTVTKLSVWKEREKPKAIRGPRKKSSLFKETRVKMKHAKEMQGETSLMIKNIPNQLRRSDLIVILDSYCEEENVKAKSDSIAAFSEYDFLYLPMDFAKHANLGYAFVNFTTDIAAARFKSVFNGFKWPVSANKKTCEVSKALIQGKEGFIKHFKNSLFPCISNSYLPVLFDPPRNGSTHCTVTVVGKRVSQAAHILPTTGK